MDEKASTTIGFFCRARAFLAAHGVTRPVRVVTDNEASYRAQTFTSLASRHQRIRPYTPRHNGKVERNNRIPAEECLYARSYSSQQQRRDTVAVWSHHYNYHRPHTACHNSPHDLIQWPQANVDSAQFIYQFDAEQASLRQ